MRHQPAQTPPGRGHQVRQTRRPAIRIGTVARRLVADLADWPSIPTPHEGDLSGCKHLTARSACHVLTASSRKPQYAIGIDHIGERLRKLSRIHRVHPRAELLRRPDQPALATLQRDQSDVRRPYIAITPPITNHSLTVSPPETRPSGRRRTSRISLRPTRCRPRWRRLRETAQQSPQPHRTRRPTRQPHPQPVGTEHLGRGRAHHIGPASPGAAMAPETGPRERRRRRGAGRDRTPTVRRPGGLGRAGDAATAARRACPQYGRHRIREKRSPVRGWTPRGEG
ncbi:hypothetical protein M2302_002915 [Micromonospora sp. A200]|nr:hypothetical protein [Micromonospora sp. A200]